MSFHGGGWWALLAHDDKKDQPKINRQVLWRVWGFAKPYQWQVAGLLLTILFISSLSLVAPLLFRQMIDEALPAKDLTQLTWLGLGLVIIPLINGLIGVAQRRLSAGVGEGIIYDLRRAAYGHMQRMSLRFFTQTRTGELMSRLNNDVIGAQSAITGTFINLITNLVSVVTTLLVMMALDWRLTLLALFVLPFFIIPARRVARTLRDIRRKSMEFNAEMNNVMGETLNVSGALLMKLFGRESDEMRRFSDNAGNVRDIGIRSAVIGQWFMLGLGVVSAVGVGVVYWMGGYLVITEAFTIGTIVAFSNYLTRLYGPLMALTNAPVQFAQSMVSFERVFEALDIPVEIQEKANAPGLLQGGGRIEFNNVSFSYDMGEKVAQGLDEIARFSWRGSDAFLKRGNQADQNGSTPEAQKTRWALQDINFVIEPGQMAALVGPSGAGKSTITYLIPRLYDPTAGIVSINDQNVRDVTLKSLSDNIGMVTQETFLFYDTIAANLRYARQNASDAEMIAAAKAANIHDFIAGLPAGYETVVGERGYRLSGGERQRIAIARVILKDPRILVLDEATSSLDSISEALIQEALQRVMRGRTTLVIAHRLSTILAADRILVLDQGQMVEQGRHDALLAQEGLYATLYETQFKPIPAQAEAER